MGFKSQVFDMLKEIGGSLIGDLFSLGFLKKILTGAVKSKIAGGEGEKGGENASEGDKIPEVKFGGYFNMSDEIAYMGLIALMESDKKLRDSAKNVSSFVSRKLLESWQRINFRVSVGTLAHIDYLKEVVNIPQDESVNKKKDGSTETKKTGGKKEEIKVNLGVEFLRSFSHLSDKEKLEVCKAAGILDPSVGQKIKEYVQKNEKGILKKIAKIKKRIPAHACDEKNPNGFFKREYKGFFREVFGLKKKTI